MDCGPADVKGLALIKAVTKVGTIYGDKGDEGDDEEALDEKGIFNFGKWAAKLPQRYEPYFGSHRFWYEGRLFVFDRSKKERQPSLCQDEPCGHAIRDSGAWRSRR
jgi:hypothetical protein